MRVTGIEVVEVCGGSEGWGGNGMDVVLLVVEMGVEDFPVVVPDIADTKLLATLECRRLYE